MYFTEEMLKTRQRMYEIMHEHTGQSVEQIAADCDRDKWLDAEAALEYGLVDNVLTRIPDSFASDHEKENDD